VTSNDPERRNSLYLAFFSPNSTDFQADYITVVEDRPTSNVCKILSPSSSLLLLAKTITHLQRSLSAIAEHLVIIIVIYIPGSIGGGVKTKKGYYLLMFSNSRTYLVSARRGPNVCGFNNVRQVITRA